MGGEEDKQGEAAAGENEKSAVEEGKEEGGLDPMKMDPEEQE